jgi:hypothetical protein
VALASWRQLCDRGEHLVLCVDFAGGRAGAGFADLAGKAPIEASFFHLERMPAGPEAVAPLATFAERWAGEVRRTGRPLRGVFGFCAGAALATAIADALVEAGTERPPVLLFDAVTVTGTTLCDQFMAAVESSTEHLTADEVDDARQLSEDLLARHGQDRLPSTAAQLVDRYRQLMTRLAARLRFGLFLRDELVGDFAAYMSYLLIASGGTLDLRDGTPVFLSSKDHEPDFEPVLHLPFQTSRNDLLRDADVAKAVADLLDREEPAPS